MDNQTTESGTGLLAKIAGVWFAVGVTSWSEAASFFTTILTIYLLGRYMWRDILRPACERRGWLAAKVVRDDA